MAQLSDRTTAGVAQKYVAIQEIKGSVVILKNRDLRSILLVSSVNFSLKSSAEQEALVFRFQEFLNGLDFSLQIIVQSRRMNIDGYLQMLEEKRHEQENELLEIQTQEYSEFIKSFVRISNIMTKLFYIVVPYSAVESKGGALEKLKHAFRPSQHARFSNERFREYANQIAQRTQSVQTNLASIGLESAVLDERELGELFLTSYNPGVYVQKTQSAAPYG
ncbi:MAG: hypothetical protein HY460_01950, partial [Parcubacteria group bacterium]|nr:hypothetical protein [Parcubacteria group bacterium]